MKQLAIDTLNLFGIELNESQISNLATYERELLDWNSRFNLTAIQDPEKVRVKHFLDSFTCLKVMKETSMDRVVDVGTGAGFPGIPIKIACPEINLTLVESVKKKADFCQHIIEKLKLENVDIINERIEVYGHSKEHREKFDWAIARAVAIMPTLVEYLIPMVRVGGNILAMKGEDAHIEANNAESAIKVLGGQLKQLVPVTLPGVADVRHLIVLGKIAATPDNFPRRVGVPSKRPIN